MSIDKVQELIDTISDGMIERLGLEPDGHKTWAKTTDEIVKELAEELREQLPKFTSQAEARGREERDRYWLKRMNNFERINKLPKDKIAGWSWLKTQISDLLTKLGDQNDK